MSVLRSQIYTENGIVQQIHVLGMHNVTSSYSFKKNPNLMAYDFPEFLFQKNDNNEETYENRVFVTIVICECYTCVCA